MESATTVVLLIEDNDTDAALTRRCLRDIKRCQYECIVASNLDQGLRALANKVDIILVDYLLGAVTGIEALKQIREAGHRTPVILMTGQGGEQVAVEAFRAGASDYLIKGAVTPQAMDRAISNTLEKHLLRMDLEQQKLGLEHANEDLRKKNEEAQTFYHTLCHELKTPLTSAREFLAIALDGLAGPVEGELRNYLQIAKQSCDLLTVYINDLIDVTRIETGKMTLRKTLGSLRPLIEKINVLLRPRASAKDIELSAEVADDLPDLDFDEKRILQVLSNLIDNAIKFTARGGKVQVGCHWTPGRTDEVSVFVRDNGAGIASSHLDRVFDRLYQVRQEDASSNEGLGIGLSICNDLVRLHGGQLRVESEPGRGSTFSFTLRTPAAGEPLATANQAGANP